MPQLWPLPLNLKKDRSGLATYEFDQFLYSSDERIFRADFSLIFDFLTLIFTFISLSLVTRSLYRAQKLRYNFQKWHLQKYGKDSSAADASEFIDGWYIIIFISDLAVIIGTILKVSFQEYCNPNLRVGSSPKQIHETINCRGIYSNMVNIIWTILGRCPNKSLRWA